MSFYKQIIDLRFNCIGGYLLEGYGYLYFVLQL